jgi:DNA-binding transcriptional LysR family regulator
MLQLQWLETFAAVVREQSITGAARTLGYTQSAVSRHISALEDDCGAQLLDRLPRGVVPTQHGLSLLEHGNAILRRLSEARHDLAMLDNGTAGRLRVAAFPTAVAALVPTAVKAFRHCHPDVVVSLVEGLSPRLLEQLAAGDADVAIVSAPPDRPIEDDSLDLLHLLDERLLVAVAVDHRLARRRTVLLGELASDPFIAGSATDENALMRARLPDGFEPVVDITVSDWTGKLGCVAAGLGVALVPALAARAVPPDVRLLSLRDHDAPVRQVFAATDSARARTTATTAFLRELQAAAQADWLPQAAT